MGLLNQHSASTLVLSTDAKPRLKWTVELHQRFVDAVNLLGGPDKATPKSLMRVMGIHGLTLYHLKSHLQKYRLGKSHQQHTCVSSPQEVSSEADYSELEMNDAPPANENFQISHAIQLQLDVQRKLREQIEVQKHLQLRIEAQGKYLQAVLKKAQEALCGHSGGSSLGMELAKAELSKLVSMVDASSSMDSTLTSLGNGCLVQPTAKRLRSTEKLRDEAFDLNAKCQADSGSGSKVIDLNCKESDHL